MPTLTFQPQEGSPSSRDTYLASGVLANSNFGNDALITIGTQNVTKDFQSLYRAILRFDLTPLAGASILAATLILTASHGTLANETFTIHRLTQPNWTEFGATWNTYDVGQAWATPGGAFVAAPAQSLVVPSVGNLVFNQLQPLVEDAMRNRGGLLDVLIKGTATTGMQILHCHSSGNATPANRPTLVVTYTHNVWCVDASDLEVWTVDVMDEAC